MLNDYEGDLRAMADTYFRLVPGSTYPYGNRTRSGSLLLHLPPNEILPYGRLIVDLGKEGVHLYEIATGGKLVWRGPI